MTLTNTKIKNTKPLGKPQRLFDGRGLYLEVAPSGGKWWRFKYRFDGKEKRLSLGVYPEIGLKEARERREEARKLLANEIDPSQHRKARKTARSDRAENSFEVIAREWIDKYSNSWSEGHTKRTLRRLEQNIFPWLGHIPASEIAAPDLLKSLQRVEDRGAVETAHRIQQICGQVFRYAIVTGRADRNPAADLKGALVPVQKQHLAAITDPKGAGDLLRAIDDYQGYTVTKAALKLAPLVFVRPGELRCAEWPEFDLDNAEWNIPAEKMKMREPHLVPLSEQALEILKDLQTLTGRGRYLFPSTRSTKRPMSSNALLAALRSMGYTKEQMTAHGFRAMARTLLDEVLRVPPDFIEHQLAHAVRDPNGRAYNRTAHLAERRKMMQKWADYLGDLKACASVLTIKAHSVA